MSCKLKYVSRLEPASPWKHKEHIPHESTLLGTPQPRRTPSFCVFPPGLTTALGDESWARNAPEQGASPMPLCACVSIYWLERDLGRVIPEVCASWILSATTVQLEVTPGHGDTPGHDSVKQSHPEQKTCL